MGLSGCCLVAFCLDFFSFDFWALPSHDAPPSSPQIIGQLPSEGSFTHLHTQSPLPAHLPSLLGNDPGSLGGTTCNRKSICVQEGHPSQISDLAHPPAAFGDFPKLQTWIPKWGAGTYTQRSQQKTFLQPTGLLRFCFLLTMRSYVCSICCSSISQ